MLKVENLYFGYDKPIFENFDLHIDNGMFGLVGKNGAGKSTLLRLIIGLLIPKGGKITVNGLDIETNRESIMKNIGVVFEKPVFPTWVIALEFLSYVGQLRGLSEEQSISQGKFLLSKLGLGDHHESKISSFSAGMTQKYAIAQAIIGLPSLIFLDEPTANLDVQTRSLVLELFKSLVDEHDITIIIMSHILSDLERYCDRIAIMDYGRIKYNEDVEKLLKSIEIIYYQIRGEEIDGIRSILLDLGVEIIRSTRIEIICKFEGPLKNLKDSLPEDIVISPYKTKLEQKFIEVTEDDLENPTIGEVI